MRKLSISDEGFSPVLIGVAIVLLVAIAVSGWKVYDNNQNISNTAKPVTKQEVKQSSETPKEKADNYKGWKLSCDPSNAKGCFKYPAEWVESRYGGFENPKNTAYINYAGLNNKDQASDEVYIARIESVNDASLGLKIVGRIYNNVPSYAIYNDSEVSTLAIDQQAKVVTVNPQFQKDGVGNMSFTATPGAKGIAEIANFEQAKAWFNSEEGNTCLKILQSLYYQ